MDRRDVLNLGIATLSWSLAGCNEIDNILGGDGSGGPSGRTGWSTYRGDAARTGVRPADAGPGDSLSVAWELSVEDVVQEIEDVDPDAESTVSSPFKSWPVLTDDFVVWVHHYLRYALESDDEQKSLRVLAVEPDDGSIAWSDPLTGADGDGPPSVYGWAPEVDDGRLYVPHNGEDGLGMLVYDPATGERETRLDLGLPALSGQPVVTDGTIYVPSQESGGDGRLYAFDASDGSERWSAETTPQQPSVPSLTVADGAVWTSARGQARGFVARDVSDGSVRRRHRVDDLPTSPATQRPVRLAPPTIADGSAYAAGDVESLLHRAMSPVVSFDTAGGSRWRYQPKGIEGPNSPIDQIIALNPDISEEEREKLAELIGPFSSLYGYPAVSDGLVFTTGYGAIGEVTDENVVNLFAIDDSTGSPSWSVEIETVTAAPVVAGDVVYVVTSNGIEAISTDGEHLDSVSRDDEPTATESPALGFGRLFVPTMRGLVAYE